MFIIFDSILCENNKVLVHSLNHSYVAIIGHVTSSAATIFINEKTELYPGDEMILEITGRDALYLGIVTLKKLIKETGAYMITLPQKFERIQRRKFDRVTTCIQAFYSDYPDMHSQYPAMILDLSGNGARIQTMNDLELYQPVQLRFTLNHNEEHWNFQLLGYSKRCIAMQPYYQYGIGFDNITELEQNKIVNYVQQRSMMLHRLEPNTDRPLEKECIYA